MSQNSSYQYRYNMQPSSTHHLSVYTNTQDFGRHSPFSSNLTRTEKNATGSNRHDYLNTSKNPEKVEYSIGSDPMKYSSHSQYLASPSMRHDQQQSDLTRSDQRMEWLETGRKHLTASPKNLGHADWEKQGLGDPRSSLRKLLDLAKDIQDLDVEKCLGDYKKMMESTDPMTLTREEEYVRSKQPPYRTEDDSSERGRLQQEVEELRQKLSELEHQDKGKNAEDVLKKELEKMRKGYEEKKLELGENLKQALEQKQTEDLERETQLKELIEKLTQELKAKDEIMSRSEKRVENLKKALKEAHEEVDKQEKEKTEALTRLSKEMGSKLSDKNPNITDLSDSNRPTKIAEKYSELYDNEWTDALETLTENAGIYTEESAIQILLACIQNAYSFCQKAAVLQMENLKKALIIPSNRSRSYETSSFKSVNPQAEKMLEEIRKSQTMPGDTLMKEFEYANDFQPVLKRLPQYTTKCLELCWLMNMHDPPVALGEPPAKHSTFDGAFYKEYTRSGTVVEFVVWLPLLLQRNGPLLQKGVVQPVPNTNRSVRQKSAHRDSASPTESVRQSKQKGTHADDNDPLLDHFFNDKHKNAGRRVKQDNPAISVLEQERGSYENLYGKGFPPTSSPYKNNPTPTITTTRYSHNSTTTPTTRYTNKPNPTTTTNTRHETSHGRPQTSSNYRSARVSGGSTEFVGPRYYRYGGTDHVLFNGQLYTLKQWEEMQKKFLSDIGSTDA